MIIQVTFADFNIFSTSLEGSCPECPIEREMLSSEGIWWLERVSSKELLAKTQFVRMGWEPWPCWCAGVCRRCAGADATFCDRGRGLGNLWSASPRLRSAFSWKLRTCWSIKNRPGWQKKQGFRFPALVCVQVWWWWWQECNNVLW